MDNQIQVFNSPQFGDVRIVLGEDNEPCFCLKDVCNVLGLRSNDVNQRLDKGVVATRPLCTSGGTQQVKFVNEDGLYDVILDSRKPEAKAFRKWVTSDVLPSIRKNGAYMTDEALEKALLSPDFGIRLFEKLKEERQARYALEVQQREQQALLLQKDERIEELDKENKKLEESSEYCRKVLQADSLVAITQIAQDYGTTANAMNGYLHKNGIQYRKNNKGPWIIYAEFIANGYVHSETFLYTDSNGIDHVKNNTKWTQKGRLFLYKWFKKRNILPVTERPEGYVLPYEIRNCKSKIKDNNIR